MTAVDRSALPDADFRARIAAIEDAPADEASAVERVARAIHDARYIQYVSPDGDVSFTEADSRTLAQAALDAMKGPDGAAEALRRVEALADVWARSTEYRRTSHHADRIRAAIAGTAS